MEYQNRQLAAILFTDIIGYTAMMQKDEQSALAATRHYISALKRSTETFHGKILNDYGDGSLCSFPSATEAVKAAVQIQQQLQQEPKVSLRIGVHVGELFFEENKVMGDSVNVASRIQSLGCANSILFSKEVFDKLRNQPEYKSVSLGKFEFKNVDEPLEIFALANEGLIVPKREQLSGKLKEIKRSSVRRKLFIAGAVFLISLAAFFAYRKFLYSPGFAGEKSIAVLPFDNAGSEKLEEYLPDGITQDIINSLSKISSLKKVIGWASVKSFKKTTKTIKQIANELDVAAMLTGSFQKQGDKIRVIAELTEAGSGKRLWGEDFDYKTSDLSTIQTDVAQKIAGALRAQLTPEEKTGLSRHNTDNEEAYKYYIKGRFYWSQRTRESFDSAEQYFKKAVAIDPEFALAYSGLADCYTLNQKGLPTSEALPIAKAYLAKALSLDSTLAQAWTSIGFMQSHFEYDWKGGERTLEKAIRLSPNYPEAHLYYGNILLFTGDINAGIKEVRKALELDPLSYSINWSLGNRYYVSSNYDLAIDQFQKTLILFPNNPNALEWTGLSYLHKKMYSQAIDLFNKLPEKIIPEKTALLSYGYALAGDKTRAEEWSAKTLSKHSNLDPYWFALIAIGLKNYQDALSQLEKGFDTRTIFMVAVKIAPDWNPIRDEPRFKAVLKKLNFE